MRTPISIIFSLFALSLAACSNGGGGSGPAAVVPTGQSPTTPAPTPAIPGGNVTGNFSYEFKVNGCGTGKQQFTAKNAYCDALLNDSLNQNCARELRVETYNRMCTANQETHPGVLPAMSTARCVVNGMDLKDRTFLQNMNPFNPQRRQIFRDMFWSAKTTQSYDILGSLVDSYGRARFQLTPSQAGRVAQGEIQLFQQKGGERFFAKAGLGTQIRMTVTNYEIEKEVEAVCLSDKSFKVVKADLSQIRCSMTHKNGGRKSTQREEMVVWDVANVVEKELFRANGRESIHLRLKPAKDGQDETLELEVADLNVDKTLRAEATLNEGLEVRYRGQESGVEISLKCAPASK